MNTNESAQVTVTYRHRVYKVVNRNYRSVFTRNLGKYALTYMPGTTVTAPDLLPMFVFLNVDAAQEFLRYNLTRGRVLTCYTNKLIRNFPLMAGIGPYILNPNHAMRAALNMATADLAKFRDIVTSTNRFITFSSPHTTAWCTELYIPTKEEAPYVHSMESGR